MVGIDVLDVPSAVYADACGQVDGMMFDPELAGSGSERRIERDRESDNGSERGSKCGSGSGRGRGSGFERGSGSSSSESVMNLSCLGQIGSFH